MGLKYNSLKATLTRYGLYNLTQISDWLRDQPMEPFEFGMWRAPDKQFSKAIQSKSDLYLLVLMAGGWRLAL